MSGSTAGPAPLALTGRVVTMSDSFAVLPRGTVYVRDGSIVAVQAAEAPAPAGFEAVTAVETGGTICPGLIELHNHLSYNALRLWDVPRKYGDRSQWAGTAKYQQLITAPMKVLGTAPGLLPAVVRYVECKCLFAGVTTSQGIQLFSNAGARRFYRGALRVVEAPANGALPPAGTRIADVAATDRQMFLKELGTRDCFLLHLSEGTDEAARAHFLSLQAPDGGWAITGSLAGIHCVALQPPDWQVMVERDASMVWSPLSNLLLYGATADVAAALAAGVRIGLGSDWAPSGSKNLLCEMKVARSFAQQAGIVLSDRDVVAMATRNAAAILHWDHLLGSIEPGKLADLVVIDGVDGDPYRAVIDASESSVQLVVIDGAPRFGGADLMDSLRAEGEAVRVHGKPHILDMKQEVEDPAIAAITLADARARLTDALARLPDLARTTAAPEPAAREAIGPGAEPRWYLALDELSDTGVDLRPALAPGMDARPLLAAPPLPIQPLRLDELTVVDDADLFERLGTERNLPPFLAPALRALY